MTMRCEECGYDDVSTRSTCPCCGYSLAQSILIPFPAAQPAICGYEDGGSSSAWRVEVQERVQAFRARRGITSALREAAQSEFAPTPQPTHGLKPSNPVVQAALARWRRASRPSVNGSMFIPDLSYGETNVNTDPVVPPPPAQVDSDPTPREISLEDPAGVSSWTSEDQLSPGSLDPLLTTTFTDSPQETLAGRPPTAMVELPAEPERVAFDDAPACEIGVRDDWFGIDDFFGLADPCESSMGDPPRESDRQQTGKRQPAKAQKRHEFSLQEASLSQRVSSGMVDLVVVLVANIPFLSLVEISGGNLADLRVRVVLGGIAFLLYLFYMTLLLMTGGKTVGMLLVRVVAVDARTMDLPSFGQALRRALGFPLALAWNTLGSVVLSPRVGRRTVSDLLSGTTLKQAFAEVSGIQAPWFYHSPKG